MYNSDEIEKIRIKSIYERVEQRNSKAKYNTPIMFTGAALSGSVSRVTESLLLLENDDFILLEDDSKIIL